MNPLNYASLEASKRLVEAGIVLGTEVCWSPIFDFNMSSVGKPVPIKDWELMHREHINSSMWALKAIPAPSMAEVWRELPVYFDIDQCFQPNLVKVADDNKGVMYSAFYSLIVRKLPVPACYQSANPTDALIELRIWLEERKEGT